MNVVFDHQIFFNQQFGGISRYYFELATGLANMDAFDVSVVAPFHINEYLRHDTNSIVKGFYFNQKFYGSGHLTNWGRSLLLPVEYALFGCADIIHETYYSPVPVGRGKTRVVTVYDMIHELFPAEFKHDPGTSLAKKAAVTRADHVICISESTRHDLVTILGVDPTKTSVIHLGHSFVSLENPSSPGQGKPVRPYLLYVGHRGGYKNFSSFCQAYADSPYLRKEFDIVAFGGPPLQGAENVFLEGLGIRKNVHQLSGNDRLLASYYQGAALFVYPSQYEGFGIPPLEAMHFGCPIACSNTSSIPEVVGNAGVYFDPSSPESIRSALEHVLEDDTLRAELIVNGAKRVGMFSWQRCSEQTAEIYKTICNER